MPGVKYDKIYKELRRRIEEEEYGFQELLPSEKVLTEQFGSSRNTVRRAIGQLAAVRPEHPRKRRAGHLPEGESGGVCSGRDRIPEGGRQENPYGLYHEGHLFYGTFRG